MEAQENHRIDISMGDSGFLRLTLCATISVSSSETDIKTSFKASLYETQNPCVNSDQSHDTFEQDTG